MAPLVTVNGEVLPTLGAKTITSLPTALTATAFVGIAWYLAVELNVRLIFTFTRRSIYFWSCLIASWGIIMHNLSIMLFNFKYWTDYSAVVVTTITWALYVVPQSVVLYSRLEIVVKNRESIRWLPYMIVFVSVIFGLGTVVLALIGRYPGVMSQRLGKINLIWDKVQVAAFFIQETIISLLYIRETRRYIVESAPLALPTNRARRYLLKHLIYINIFIIALDCSLMGLCYAGYFFLQGHYKVVVYAVKLRAEFGILNQLRSSLNSMSRVGSNRNEYGTGEVEEISAARFKSRKSRESGQTQDGRSQDSDIQMVPLPLQIRVDTEIKVDHSREKTAARRSMDSESAYSQV